MVEELLGALFAQHAQARNGPHLHSHVTASAEVIWGKRAHERKGRELAHASEAKAIEDNAEVARRALPAGPGQLLYGLDEERQRSDDKRDCTRPCEDGSRKRSPQPRLDSESQPQVLWSRSSFVRAASRADREASRGRQRE